ncbi:hypothetical protein TIFTF001_029442 [Ficus carica]|uniref:Uncharacterized protein n=1 Tax=Ficus carica TaxID=3494 RepID=A0AA88IY17_FICCA|nr:hypothetical protein TIFTF001_029442 [Ficus carica]
MSSPQSSVNTTFQPPLKNSLSLWRSLQNIQFSGRRKGSLTSILGTGDVSIYGSSFDDENFDSTSSPSSPPPLPIALHISNASP